MQDAVQTLRHETLAHFGLNLLAPGDKIALLGDIIADKRIRVIGEIFNQIEKACSEMVSDRFKKAGAKTRSLARAPIGEWTAYDFFHSLQSPKCFDQ